MAKKDIKYQCDKEILIHFNLGLRVMESIQTLSTMYLTATHMFIICNYLHSTCSHLMQQ